ncbi:MAG: nucleotidyltransferase family protein [Planctomycetota bacterium]
MTTYKPRIFAIVPAAGRSRRMGTAKQLLDVGGATMLNSVMAPLAAARVAGIALVTHSGLVNQLAAERFADTFIALNDDETSDMIDSVRIGLAAWAERETIRERDGFLVCPADHPGITTADFDTCVAAFRDTPDQIVIATRAGKRGHPIIFPGEFLPFVQSTACDSGLNALPRAHAQRVLTAPCHSTGVTRDVDTPQDYERTDS